MLLINFRASTMSIVKLRVGLHIPYILEYIKPYNVSLIVFIFSHFRSLNTAKYRSLIPKKKGVEPYKVGVERLKKYDKMLSAFPSNLEIPVEPAFLRLLVRRRRQNQNKRVKKESTDGASVSASVASASATVATPIKRKKPKVLKLQIPQASKEFPTIAYNEADFLAGNIEKK